LTPQGAILNNFKMAPDGVEEIIVTKPFRVLFCMNKTQKGLVLMISLTLLGII
jgi:hypothetical protein